MTCSACAVIYKPRAESFQTRFQPNNYHRRSVITEIFSQAHYTYKLYKDEILQDYIKALETDEGRQLLNCFGLSKEERYSWKIGFDERMNNNFLFDFVKKDLDRSVIQKIEINNDIFN